MQKVIIIGAGLGGIPGAIGAALQCVKRIE